MIRKYETAELARLAASVFKPLQIHHPTVRVIVCMNATLLAMQLAGFLDDEHFIELVDLLRSETLHGAEALRVHGVDEGPTN